MPDAISNKVDWGKVSSGRRPGDFFRRESSCGRIAPVGMRWIFLGFFLLNIMVTKGQNITSFAGCVSMSCSGVGDGHPATSANLNDPIKGVFDKYGNFYFAEGLGQRIRKINTSGIITTLVGDGSSGFGGDNGPATTALLREPSVVLLDTLGNLYIDDLGNFRIRKVNTSTGIISTICGNGTGGFLGDGGPATAAEIWGVQDICFDKFGNLYLADNFNDRVRKINSSGIISTFAGSGGFSSLGTGDGGPATSATFNFIDGLAADDTGNIYIADLNTGKVRKVDTFGIINTLAGNGSGIYIGDGMTATAASLAPEFMTFDDTGNLIISDRANERIYKINTAGIFYCIAGIGGTGSISGDGGPATASSFDAAGVSFDPCWNLYICDIDNDRVRKVSYHTYCNFDSIALIANQMQTLSFVDLRPNPASSTITITSPNKLSQITISNLIGQTKYSQAYEAEKVEIDIANLPPGIYMVAIIDEEGNKNMKKILKE